MMEPVHFTRDKSDAKKSSMSVLKLYWIFSMHWTHSRAFRNIYIIIQIRDTYHENTYIHKVAVPVSICLSPITFTFSIPIAYSSLPPKTPRAADTD